MARRDRTPDSWPGWSDARPVDDSDTLPDTERSTWQICWIRRHAQWHPAIITAWRRTIDGGWAAHTAWGLGENDYGWIRHSDRTMRPAEPPSV
jgi:hypothetical protein